MSRIIIKSYKFTQTNNKDIYGNTYYNHSLKSTVVDLPSLQQISKSEFKLSESDLTYLTDTLKFLQSEINHFWSQYQKFGVAFIMNLKKLVFDNLVIDNINHNLKDEPVIFKSDSKTLIVSQSHFQF